MSPCVVSMCSSLQSLSILSERVFTWPTVNYVTTEDDNDNDHSIVAWRHSTEQENIKKRIWTIKVSLLSSSLLYVDRNLCVFVLLVVFSICSLQCSKKKGMSKIVAVHSGSDQWPLLTDIVIVLVWRHQQPLHCTCLQMKKHKLRVTDLTIWLVPSKFWFLKIILIKNKNIFYQKKK